MLAQRLAEHLLGLAARVHVGGVVEIDAGLERAPDDGVGLLLRRLPEVAHRSLAGAEGHRAEGKTRDDEARVSELGVFHAIRKNPTSEHCSGRAKWLAFVSPSPVGVPIDIVA